MRYDGTIARESVLHSVIRENIPITSAVSKYEHFSFHSLAAYGVAAVPRRWEVCLCTPQR